MTCMALQRRRSAVRYSTGLSGGATIGRSTQPTRAKTCARLTQSGGNSRPSTRYAMACSSSACSSGVFGGSMSFTVGRGALDREPFVDRGLPFNRGDTSVCSRIDCAVADLCTIARTPTGHSHLGCNAAHYTAMLWITSNDPIFQAPRAEGSMGDESCGGYHPFARSSSLANAGCSEFRHQTERYEPARLQVA